MSINNILHIDMNSFFASVEQAANPFLKGKPIVVAGDADPDKNYARTIVTTASYEARPYGIKTGMTIPEAKKRCPHIIIVTADTEKYLDVSMQIHKILLKFTDLVEVYSIDECFMDFTGAQMTAAQAAPLIKRDIKEALGLTCSIGIATNKLLAKYASDLKKPDGLTIINDEDVPELFSKVQVQELWGIGRHLSGKMYSLGIKTAKDLGEASEDLLKAEFGILGRVFKLMGQGKYESRIVSYYSQRIVKSAGHSHTLPENTFDLSVVKGFIRMLAEKTARRLTKYGLKGRVVHFYVRYADFSGFGRQVTLQQHTNSGLIMFRVAEKIFDATLPLIKRVRLVGISVGMLKKEDGQAYLLEDLEDEKKISETMYKINEKYGEFVVKPASVLIAENFGIKERCGMIGRYLFDRKV
jgi:DNA polymerase-4